MFQKLQKADVFFPISHSTPLRSCTFNQIQELERAKFDLEIAQRNGNFEAASRLTYDVIPNLQKQTRENKGGVQPGEADEGVGSFLRDRVTSEDVATVVARATGIPVQNLLKGEKQKLIHVSVNVSCVCSFFSDVTAQTHFRTPFSPGYRWRTRLSCELSVKIKPSQRRLFFPFELASVSFLGTDALLTSC